jgi:hypothetical protein
MAWMMMMMRAHTRCVFAWLFVFSSSRSMAAACCSVREGLKTKAAASRGRFVDYTDSRWQHAGFRQKGVDQPKEKKVVFAFIYLSLLHSLFICLFEFTYSLSIFRL